MAQQADLVVKSQPVWDEPKVDAYAWMFGAHAMFQQGGRHWQTWAEAMDNAVVKNQRTEGNFAGSWDPIGVWGEDGGRIYSTAMLCLALQAHYRFTRMTR